MCVYVCARATLVLAWSSLGMLLFNASLLPALHIHRGALNAYSRALELDDAIPLVWANRGACHLALGGHEAAVGDCTHALVLLLTRQDRYAKGVRWERAKRYAKGVGWERAKRYAKGVRWERAKKGESSSGLAVFLYSG